MVLKQALSGLCQEQGKSLADCPCDDEHGGRRYGPACSCCYHVTPLPKLFNFLPSIVVAIFSPVDPLFLLPQVYSGSLPPSSQLLGSISATCMICGGIAIIPLRRVAPSQRNSDTGHISLPFVLNMT
jgi:hypothetical protein